MPGGPSLFSARMALAFGARVTLLTRLTATFDGAALAGIDVHAVPAATCPRYANTYDARGERTQQLISEGEPLDLALLAGTTADAVIVAPAYHECGGLPEVATSVIGVSLQGPLRTVGPSGTVRPHPDAIGQAEPFLKPGAFAFFSEEDTAEPVGLAREIAGRGAMAILTRGYRGATLYAADEVRHLEALPAAVVDPTGAGDCFSTAFVVRLAESGDLDDACRYALAAGALAVEGYGIAAIPTRAQVEARLGKVAA